MLQVQELTTEHIRRSLRIYAMDLTDRFSPFNKNDDYFKDLSSWLLTASERLEEYETGKRQK